MPSRGAKPLLTLPKGRSCGSGMPFSYTMYALPREPPLARMHESLLEHPW
ncbi:unnamed protein product [Meloidogyne enterolobii]|uniref:Uncharacterized protein n=1 Tax=Meloidogyne enterolobii TaxID=390850 RepID=A0ACB1APJ3_MELEN